jgi:glycosyltransferase involved in cell wall biosynthesis
MTTKVSAILTTYQRPDLAKRALKSIFAQTWPAAEIIIVEDGGDSDLHDWIDSLNQADTRYIRHDKNLGLASARNTGLRLAQSELIAYLDDDDEWLPTRLEEQIERFQSLSPERRQRLAAIQVGCKILDPQGRQIGIRLPVNQGNLRESIIDQGAATPSSSFMFVRSALVEIHGFDEALINGIDHDIWMKFAVAGFSSEIITKPLVVLYKDDRETMMSNTQKRVTGLELFIEKWTPTYQEWFGQQAGKNYAKKYFIGIIAKLAGEKFARARFRDGLMASKAALQCAGWHPNLLVFSGFCLLRSYMANAFPRLREKKRALFRQKAE